MDHIDFGDNGSVLSILLAYLTKPYLMFTLISCLFVIDSVFYLFRL